MEENVNDEQMLEQMLEQEVEQEVELPLEEEDEYSDMPGLIMYTDIAHFGIVAFWHETLLSLQQEKMEAVQALWDVAQQEAPEELAIQEGDADYITGEDLVKGSHGFVLDECRTSPLSAEAVLMLLQKREDCKKHINPLTQLPIRAIQKVLFV